MQRTFMYILWVSATRTMKINVQNINITVKNTVTKNLLICQT